VNKEYNGNSTATATGTAALSGIIGSDVVTLTGTPSYTFTQSGVGTGIGITTAGYTLGGAAAGNYSLTQPSLTANITTKAIAITPNSNQRKIYGESDPVLTYTFSGDIAGQTPGFDNTLTRAQGEAVGAYAIGLGSLSLKDNGLFKATNYSLVLTSGVDFTIGKAPLVANVNADSKFVTQTDATGYAGLTYSGFKFGEGPSVLNTTNLVISRTNLSQQAAGTYANVLVGSGITASNYAITYQPGSYTIVAADELLVKLGNREVIYGETAVYQVVSAGYFSSSGQRVVDLTSNTQVQGRKVTVTDGASGGAEFNIGIGSPVLSGSGKVSVGTYPLVAENTVLTSANFSNKLVLQGNLEVKTKSLGVSVSGGKSKPYDGNVQMLSLTLGLATSLTGDEVTAAGTGVYAGKNVGASNYTVSGITLSGSHAFNYVVQGGSNAQITGTDGQITTRSLAVVPTVGQSKAFGEADPILTYTYSGQVSGEVPGFSGAMSRLTGQTEGAYGITRGTLGLVDSGNFLATNYLVDFTAGVNFTIVGANQLLVKLSPTEATYGSAPQYGVASVGYFSSGNQFVDLTANTQLSGTRLTVSDGASGTAVFDVAVVSPQRSTSTTLKAGNYTLAAENIVETSPNFGNTVVLQGMLKVNPKQLSASVSGGKVKGYDGNAGMQNIALSLSGSIQGDVLAIQGSGQYDSKNAGIRSYTVSGITLSGADAANYFIQGGTNASVQGADGEITKRALTLTPNSGQKKGYGSADPVFTYTFSGQVQGETLTFSGLLSRVSGEAVGTYGITLGTLSAGGNYNLVLSGTVQFEIQAVDTDGDGVLDLKEIEDKTDPINPCSLVVEHQTEPSGIQNWDSLDCDGDGVSNGNEIKSTLKDRAPGVSFGSQDTDRDGIPDYLDTDDDGDGVLTKNELPDRDKDGKPDDAVDTDGDGVADYLDTDDDGDGILTKSELPDRDGDGKPDDAVDTDGDGVADYLDTDDDGDGTLTKNQLMDTDQDGIPDYFDSDDDGDGVPDYIEVIDGTDINDADDVKDTDRDGVPDYVETQQGTSPSNPQDFKDSDGDGVPDYVEVQQGTNPTIASDAKDSDKDGVADHIQFRSIRVTKREDVVLLWGDKNYRSALPKAVEVTLYSGAKATLEVVWTAPETVNIFKRGTTELKGTIVLPKGVYNPYKVNGLVRLVVLPKPAPRDVTITNNTFVGSTTQFFISIGDFKVNDPVDNIHVVSLLGDGYDNKYFEIKNNILFWSSADRAAGKTTFSIVVRVTDRDGNTLDKFFEINRTRPDFSSLIITNAFSPNGDGTNEGWGVLGIRFYEGARISVYDRGGSRLFYTENPDIRWDGTYDGKEMPVGSYFWVIEILETGEMRKGMLNLLRK
jgi:gliding motility-associated-like protein